MNKISKLNKVCVTHTHTHTSVSIVLGTIYITKTTKICKHTYKSVNYVKS